MENAILIPLVMTTCTFFVASVLGDTPKERVKTFIYFLASAAITGLVAWLV